MRNIINKSLFAAMSLIASTSAMVHAVPVVDGFMSTNEYANSFNADWYNGHNQSGSQYQQGDGNSTTVYWEDTGSNFYLYVEAPVEVKNMIWGNGFTNAEALDYYNHWCSPNDGNPAAPDGSNCDHHNNGFNTFMTSKTDYDDMTKSEKVIFGDPSDNAHKITADLTKNASSGNFYGAIEEYMDSADYVIANLGCDTTDCDAMTTPMAFEFKFENSFSQLQINALISDVQTNEIEFHLSPERGAEPVVEVPEPSSVALFGFALMALGLPRRKQNS